MQSQNTAVSQASPCFQASLHLANFPDAGQEDDTKVGGTIDGETPDQRRARIAAERRKRSTRPGRANKTPASKFAIPARERGETGPRSASVVQLSLDL